MRARLIALYCLIVYILAWALQFAAIRTVGELESAAAKPWLAAGMFVPALVALAFVWSGPKTRHLLLWRPTWRMLPLLPAAVAVPTIFGLGTVAICEVAGWGKSGWFVFAPGGVTISGGGWLLGGGEQAWPIFLANVAVTAIAYAAISALAAMGEELGWRGFLQGPLIAKLGTTRGIVLLGLIWSFWHLPILLAGYNFPQTPMLGASVLFPVMLVSFSFFLGWLTLKSNTFWPAAMAHGAFNSISVGITGNLRMETPEVYRNLAQLAIMALFGLLFWSLLLARDRSKFRNVARQSMTA